MSLGEFQKRVLIPVRQRPSSEDLNALQTMLTASDLLVVGSATGQNFESSPTGCDRGRYIGAYGFTGSDFFVDTNPSSPPFGVRIRPGRGFDYNAGPAAATDIDSCQGADWNQTGMGLGGIPLVLSTYQNLTVPTPPSAGNSRIDIIEVRADYLATDPQTVGIFDPGSSVFNPTVANKALVWDLLGRTGSVSAPNPSTAPISYVTGQTAAGGITAATEPPTTAGYLKICRINLDASGGAIAALTDDMIADKRPRLFPAGTIQLGGNVTTAGVLAGVGSQAFNSLEVPMGLVVKAVMPTTAPSAGFSYPVQFYVIGGELRPRTVGAGARGAVTATAEGPSPRCMGITNVVTDTLLAADVAILDGTTVGYSILNGADSFAVGQPVFRFTVQVMHPAGSALSSTETFFFNATLNLG